MTTRTWLFDVKCDGFWGLCYIEPGRSRFISRNGNWMRRFDALAEQVAAALGVDNTVLDGELVASDKTGRPQFYEFLRGTRLPSYVAFDVIWLNGTDLRSLPLHDRAPGRGGGDGAQN